MLFLFDFFATKRFRTAACNLSKLDIRYGGITIALPAATQV